MSCSVDEAVAAIRRGRPVIVVDAEDRENEGDVVVAADTITIELMTLLIRHTSGIVCVPMEPARLDALGLPQMVDDNTEAHRTAFTVSVDERWTTTTGISARDRVATVRALKHERTRPADLARPGHVFPLRARAGGVLKRAGHTEAAVDLTRLAGRTPAAVIAEIMNDDGTVARLPDLQRFAEHHGMPLITISDIVRYRMDHERLVVRTARVPVRCAAGAFTVHAYRCTLDGQEHLALVHGDIAARDDVLVRVHSECLTGDLFGSQRCDCGPQLHASLARIVSEGAGVVVYLRGHEGRGIGLTHKLRAYSLQDGGLDTVEANQALGVPVDDRDYGIGAQILRDLGVRRMRLLTNNPAKYTGLAGYGLDVVDRVALQCGITADNLRYLRSKRDKLGHLLDLPDELPDDVQVVPR
ncbi:bifunctional 3,4-dihydroxy-2-butanone-4-phosphate synthase/GTP cyclohydrolase II [Mycobacterium sp. SM1]|uniref:bifunctional 3,4-dihydroxy-2-butanone-4-phosphate synthase/GTP cyclohydrolase II n=1 Tax=Mycobacterium sp. SM1 TaxID=2816243 RepID=UPI001BD09A41|nr:bifunctional 3,4-dihydroxy-2-butanone-4-phosphate synthase/GTP cyclohydrolase II [Mycobacterium sp. SM1]MBS4729017.1 bifunctional 3,4-dihydroxy-2-butanone-4-phosphate synthase/GTP cyclohydrolase II [Mycobacterium sp. SM1]